VHKTPRGPDQVDLAAFSTTPVDARLDLVDHDNSGWSPWWIKSHPNLPGALRYGGAAALAALTILGALRVRRVVATTTDGPTPGPPPRPGPS
jgi:hypothetical protein